MPYDKVINIFWQYLFELYTGWLEFMVSFHLWLKRNLDWLEMRSIINMSDTSSLILSLFGFIYLSIYNENFIYLFQ